MAQSPASYRKSPKVAQCYACDGGPTSRTASLATFVQDIKKKHPGNNPRNKPLGWASCQPTLIKGRRNRIIIFRGSFNPPHVGHLNLLTYAFEHGGQDIRAAIIMTTSDKSLESKFTNTDETIRLSKKRRQRLWKNDWRLPDWVWVYEDSSEELKAFRHRLRQKAFSLGYELEYVLLFGPDGIDLFKNFSTQDQDHRCRSADCNQALVCDVSREAGLPNQSTELRSFPGFEPWRKLELDEQALDGEANAEAEDMLAILMAKAPKEYRRAVERGDHTTKKPVTVTMNDAEHIWVCHQICNPRIQWRFVRANRVAYPEYKDGTISSTMLRAAMKLDEDDQEKVDLMTMALSPHHLLLWMRSQVIRRLRAADESRKENDQPLSPNIMEL